MFRACRISLISTLVVWLTLRLLPDLPPFQHEPTPNYKPSESVFSDVWNFLTGVPGDIAGLATSVWHSFTSFWDSITGLTSEVSDAWGWMWNGARWLGDETVSFASHVIDGTEWLLTHAIPSVFTSAVTWSYHAIQNVGDEAFHLVENTANTIYQWAVGALNTLQGALEDALDFVTTQLSTVIHWVDVAGNWLWNIVYHAAELVAWFWASFVLMLLREFWSLVESIGKWIWQQIRQDTKAFVHAIEDVVSAIF